MKLIVGLGNPGDKYTRTRHNSGFLVVDALAEKLDVNITRKAFDALIGRTQINHEQVVIMKPQTFMNDSGRAVQKAVSYYHLDVKNDLLVIYDDLDLPCGKIRLRRKGSAGGHNGMKSIISCINTNEFNRIRIGIDKDPYIPVIDYVLGKVKKEDLPVYNEAIINAAAASRKFIDKPFDKVMNEYNIKEIDV